MILKNTTERINANPGMGGGIQNMNEWNEANVTIAVSLPVSTRDFLVKEAEKAGKRLSPYLRDFFNALYDIRRVDKKMEKDKNVSENIQSLP